jgi:hypothetical protein
LVDSEGEQLSYLLRKAQKSWRMALLEEGIQGDAKHVVFSEHNLEARNYERLIANYNSLSSKKNQAVIAKRRAQKRMI